ANRDVGYTRNRFQLEVAGDQLTSSNRCLSHSQPGRVVSPNLDLAFNKALARLKRHIDYSTELKSALIRGCGTYSSRGRQMSCPRRSTLVGGARELRTDASFTRVRMRVIMT